MFKREPSISLSEHRAIVADWKALLKEAYRQRDFLIELYQPERISAPAVERADLAQVPATLRGGGNAGADVPTPPATPLNTFGQGWNEDDWSWYENWCREQGDLTEDVLEERWLERYGRSASPVDVLSA